MLRGAIVGFGEVARNGHWPAYRAAGIARIVAVVDRTAERRAVASVLDPAVCTFATIGELATAGVAIDFVDICTPPAFHSQPIREAIHHGWHVLCEKPFVIDEAILADIRRDAAQANRAVVPVHNWKYAPILQAATRLLRTGAIGRLRRVEIEAERLRDAAVADPAHPNWRRDPAVAGGGILMDHGWHAVYLALDWFGQTPTRVDATLHRPSPAEVEDEASLMLGFPGGTAAITLTWNGRRRRNALQLVGDAGTIRVDDDVLRVTGGRTIEQLFPTALSAGSSHPDWFAAMVPDIVSAFEDRARAAHLFEEAAQCLAIIQQAYRADTVAAAFPAFP
jgi:predicted dehydrogenase